MSQPRITQLADGEELISFEVDECTAPLVDDPRQELLAHRRAAEAASEGGATELSEAWSPNGSPACRRRSARKVAGRGLGFALLRQDICT